MPREVVRIGPRHLVFQEYEDSPLKPNEVRIKTSLSSVNHGTMLAGYRGEVREKTKDSKYLIWLERDKEKPSIFKPGGLGSMFVGVISEVGNGVTRFKVGDRVYGHGSTKETRTVPEDRVQLAPRGLTDEEMVCTNPAGVAMMGVREGNVKIGEKVAVFGLGAIGLMAIQLAGISGSLLVVGVEPFEKRREMAEKYGADALLDPTRCDAGLETRKLTNMEGVDIAIEASGSYHALHHAIRATRYGGTVVTVSLYHGEGKGLNLGEEWHINRQIMVAGARVESEPYRDYPRWNRRRIDDTTIQLIMKKKLKVDGMLDPIVKFDEVIEGYRLIDEEPEKTIKLAVKYE